VSGLKLAAIRPSVNSMMSYEQVTARQMLRHHLTGGPGTIAEVAADVAGIHAQVMSAAEIALGQRVPGSTRADVRDALWAGRSLVKTRGPRGTVHLLAAADLPMWTGALSAVPYANPWPADVRMTAEQIERVIAAAAQAVEDAELTVDELTDAIVAIAGPWAGDRVMEAFQDRWPRWRQVEHLAANRGAICSGPDRGRRATYTSPRRWLPGFAPAPADTATAELAHRYLRAYGPATPAHFARWLGTPVPWATALFERLGDTIQPVDVEGWTGWVTAGDTTTVERYAGVTLLPYFDAYLVGCHPRDRLFPGRAGERALNGGQAGNFPALLVDGVVAGVWHQRRSGRRLAVTVEALTPLSARQRRELNAEVERVGQILEGAATLTEGPVAVGPHA
jgi:hypothetical protein